MKATVPKQGSGWLCTIPSFVLHGRCFGRKVGEMSVVFKLLDYCTFTQPHSAIEQSCLCESWEGRKQSHLMWKHASITDLLLSVSAAHIPWFLSSFGCALNHTGHFMFWVYFTETMCQVKLGVFFHIFCHCCSLVIVMLIQYYKDGLLPHLHHDTYSWMLKKGL